MIKKILPTTGILFGVLLTSCLKQERTIKENLELTVTNYIEGTIKKESTVKSYSLDSIEVTNITKKMDLRLEILDINDELKKLVKERDKIKKEYYEKKELENMYSKLGKNEDAFYKSNKIKLEELTLLFENKKKLGNKMLSDLDSLYSKSKIADSIETVYFHVFARGTIVTTNNIQKNTIHPFYISKEYKILKEPIELINNQI